MLHKQLLQFFQSFGHRNSDRYGSKMEFHFIGIQLAHLCRFTNQPV
jgi:hypothetical protein